MNIPAKHTVLVVDDEFSIRDNLEQLLKTNGYGTVVSGDGQEALERASEQEFEVVLLDIRMPGLSGLDVLRQLRSDHPDIAVIMVTAVSDVEAAVEACRLGAYDYVTKPFDLDDILMRVEKARERRQLALQVENHQQEIEKKLLERERELRATTVALVESLIREATIAEGEGARGRSRSGTAPGAQAREFGLKVLRRLYGGE